MPLTLVGASVTDFGTVLANLRGELRPATHEGHGRQTNLSAIAIEANAVCQLGDIRFSQASIKAMIAFARAFHARLNTTSMFMMAHRSSPIRKGWVWSLGHVETLLREMLAEQSAFRLTWHALNDSKINDVSEQTLERAVVQCGQFLSNQTADRSMGPKGTYRVRNE